MSLMQRFPRLFESMNAVKTAGGWQFDPVLENGKPLVRPVTAADIDRIGPACMDIINGDA